MVTRFASMKDIRTLFRSGTDCCTCAQATMSTGASITENERSCVVGSDDPGSNVWRRGVGFFHGGNPAETLE